jgi:FkbM family methyltransferase
MHGVNKLSPNVLQRSAGSLLGRSIDRISRRMGFRITLQGNTLQGKRAEVLNRLRVTTILDVGANTGQYAQEVRQCGFQGRIVSFEPVPEAYLELCKTSNHLVNHTCFPVALGASEGTQKFWIAQDTACSSLREPEGRLSRAHEGVLANQNMSVPVRTLDSLNGDVLRPGDVAYLKIDTQGSEPDVIAGASNALESVVAIEIELSLVPLYKGQELLPSIWNLLCGAGYEPYWLERGYRDPHSGRLAQVDALFVRASCFAPAELNGDSGSGVLPC